MRGDRFIVLALTVAASACSSNARDGSARDARAREPAAPRLGVHAIDLGDVIGAAAIAFRSAGDRIVAHGRYHSVAVSSDRVSFIPRVAGIGAHPFALRTVIRGADGATTPFGVSGPTSVSRTVQGIQERIENNDAHVQQTWSFASRPVGPVTVRVETDGYAHTADTNAGLHFIDWSGHVQVRYGHATWIDARGTRTSIKARWTGRFIEFVLDAPLLAASVFPATLDPIMVVEKEVDAPLLVPDVRGQGTATVATSPMTSLAVFTNGSTFQVGASLSGLFMVHLGLDGAPTDACGIPLSSSAVPGTLYGAPVITYAGGVFLAAWLQSSGCNFELRARRLDQTGTFLDASDLVIATGSSCTFSGRLSVGFDGNRFLLVWRNDSTAALAGAILATDGTLESTLTFGTVDGSLGAVSGLPGGGWVIGWVEPGPRNVFLTHVAANGSITGLATMVPGSGLASSPALASSGAELLLAWSDGDIHAQRLDATGSLVGAAFSVTSDSPVQERPTIAWDGAAWFIAWEDARSGQPRDDVYARRISAAGALLGTSDALVFQGVLSGASPWVGSALGGVVAAQTIPSDPSSSLAYTLSTIRRYDASGVALDTAPVPIVRCANPERRPAVAWNGSEFLVVWEDDRNGPDTDLYGVRVGPDGAILDQTAIPISTSPSTQTHPVVVSDGAKFFVVWEDFRTGSHLDIFGTVVDASGVVASPTGIQISTSTKSTSKPVVAAGGGRFFVAWKTFADEVEARILDSSASAIGPTFIVAPFSGYDPDPRVSYGNDQFIVSFQGSARRYDLTGAALDTTPISLASNIGGPGGFGVSNDSWMFAFTGDFSVQFAPHARRVEFDGSLPQSAPSSLGASAAIAPRPVWDGEQYLVVWEAPTSGAYAAPHSLYAKRVTDEAEAVEATPLALTDGIVDASFGDVAAGPVGSFLVVFHAWEGAVPYVNNRVRALLVTVDGFAPGAACTDSAECRSGLCVDGVCCRVRCGDGAPADCEACSIAAGGSLDGTCTAIAAGPVCRPTTGECDVPDSCDGTHRMCPADVTVENGVECTGGTCHGGVCVPPADAGTPDAPPPDAAPPVDAAPDVALPDASIDASIDASMPDASVPDAAVPDARPADASLPDSALADATSGDARQLDASATDGSSSPPILHNDTGCGCQGPRDASSSVVWLATVLLVGRRRRPVASPRSYSP